MFRLEPKAKGGDVNGENPKRSEASRLELKAKRDKVIRVD